MKKLVLLFIASIVMLGVMNAATLTEGFNSTGWGSSYGNYTVNGWSLTNVYRETTNKYEGASAVRFNTNGSVKSIISPLKSDGLGTLTFWYRRWSSTDGSVVLDVFKSSDGSSWGTSIGSVTASSDTYSQYTLAINDASAKYIKVESASTYKRCVLDYFEITDPVAGPSLVLNPNTLSAFSYNHNNGPSQELSFSVVAENLTGNLSVSSVGTNFSVSSTEGGTYGTSLTLIPSSGAVDATVYVILNSGLSIGDYSNNVSVSGGGATAQSVACSGTVTTPPAPNAPTASSATVINSNGFTAHWSSVSGATGYYLDVYTKTAGTYATDLIISEYVEGSSNNKYIEVYNGTGSAVDLGNYYLRLYANGAAIPTNNVQLSGTLQHGATIVYKNGSAALTLPDGVTATTNGAVNFNGDDAVALYNANTSSFVDIFGMIGQDPGTAWTINGITTLDKTLVRKSSVQDGISENPSGYNNDDVVAFETLESQWNMFDLNTVSNLGSHTMAGGPTNNYVTGYNGKNVGNVTSYEVTGLDPETTYYYVVRAYDAYSQASANSNEIEVTTDAEVGEVVVNADGTATGATIVSGGTIPGSLLGTDTGIPAVVYTITASGISDVTVYRPTGFGSIDWYCWLNTSGGLIAGGNPISTASYVFNNVDFDAKGDVTVILNDNETLPVELSSFTATVDAHNYVQLTWVTQSETNVMGFYVYRSATNNLSTAELISPMVPATNTSQQQFYTYTDNDLFADGMYYYWLQNSDIDGSSNFHGPVHVTYSSTGQNNGSPEIPAFTELKAIYPNPFNPIAYIPYSLASLANVDIKIYNARGQMVRSFAIGTKEIGSYRLEWNGMDNNGKACSTGVYYVRMTVGNDSFIRKAVLMK